jgi:hypothetical protein
VVVVVVVVVVAAAGGVVAGVVGSAAAAEGVVGSVVVAEGVVAAGGGVSAKSDASGPLALSMKSIPIRISRVVFWFIGWWWGVNNVSTRHAMRLAPGPAC